ncbi:MAG: hypothetical protein DYG94_03530 [Leptolyngbya sp. PLA3]|nr:MAG: hypothetical protein EDM82_09010 [Cyanobacteria bacterium CYA]MCE7967800.1 hypothetical protein [Leptolyngbya sp. PL-A3]
MLTGWQVGGLVAGVVIACGGVYVLRFSRTRAQCDADRSAGPDAGALESLLGRTSVSTRAAIGLSLLVLGYHLAAYALPAGWLWLKVPPERLWILGLSIALLVGGSIALDRAEDRQ